MPKQPGSPTGIGPTRRQADAGKALLDVRRLAAVDMYGSRGGRRRRRLILAEFALAAIDIPLLGLAIVLAASSVPRVLLGAYLIGVGLNYVPLALHAISLSRAGRLDAELAGADAGAELRRHTAKQLFIAIPLLVLILGALQFTATRRAPSQSRMRTTEGIRISLAGAGRWTARHPWLAPTIWITLVAASVVIGTAAGVRPLPDGEFARGNAVLDQQRLWGPASTPICTTARKSAAVRASQP
jgi:hypothetical protein